jgi:hypothetical protein
MLAVVACLVLTLLLTLGQVPAWALRGNTSYLRTVKIKILLNIFKAFRDYFACWRKDPDPGAQKNIRFLPLRNTVQQREELYFQPLKLLNFDVNAYPYQPFHSTADPDPASKNNEDPCGSGSAILSSVYGNSPRLALLSRFVQWYLL